MKKKDELTGILSQAAQALRTSLVVCFLFTALRALLLPPRKVFDTIIKNFLKWQINGIVHSTVQ